MGNVFGKTFDVCEDVEEQFVCPHCDKTYQSEQALLKHIETKHPPENG